MASTAKMTARGDRERRPNAESLDRITVCPSFPPVDSVPGSPARDHLRVLLVT
jgi:hypothetical protein